MGIDFKDRRIEKIKIFDKILDIHCIDELDIIQLFRVNNIKYDISYENSNSNFSLDKLPNLVIDANDFCFKFRCGRLTGVVINCDKDFNIKILDNKEESIDLFNWVGVYCMTIDTQNNSKTNRDTNTFVSEILLYENCVGIYIRSLNDIDTPSRLLLEFNKL